MVLCRAVMVLASILLPAHVWRALAVAHGVSFRTVYTLPQAAVPTHWRRHRAMRRSHQLPWAVALLNLPLYLLLPAALVRWPGQSLLLLGLFLALSALYLVAVYVALRSAPRALWLIAGAGLL